MNSIKCLLLPLFFSITVCQAIGYTKTQKDVSRIIQGWPAKDHQFPHQAHLLLVYNTGGFSECGGSLISPNYILTSAQCLESKVWALIRLGHSNVTTPELVLQSNYFIRHPDFDKYTYRNDLGLIKLVKHVDISDTINTIRLPRLSDLFRTFENETAIVSGWGYVVDGGTSSEYLNYVELRVISRVECLKVYAPSIVRNTTLCAVGKHKETDGTCFRDTGGPMTVIDEDGELTQIGVISFAAGSSDLGCASKYPSGYTRMSYYVGWIEAMTKIPVRP